MHIELQTKPKQPHKCVFSSCVFFSFFFHSAIVSEVNLSPLVNAFLISFSLAQPFIEMNSKNQIYLHLIEWIFVDSVFWWDSKWDPFGMRYVVFSVIIRCLFGSVHLFSLIFVWSIFSQFSCSSQTLSIAHLLFGIFSFDPYMLLTFWCIRFNQSEFILKQFQLDSENILICMRGLFTALNTRWILANKTVQENEMFT